MPFIKISDYKIILDTGSTQNYINPNLVKPNFSKFPELFTVHTCNGKSSGKEFTFFQYKNLNIKSYIFNFHKDFHILLGIPGIKLLKTKFDFTKEEITFLNKYKFKLQYLNTKKDENFNIEIKNHKIRDEHLNSEEKRQLYVV